MSHSAHDSTGRVGTTVDTPIAVTDWLGSVDHMIIEFPPDRIPVAGFAELLSLVDSGTVRILDLEFVTRVDGQPTVVTAESLGSDLAAFTGACSGLLDDLDLATAVAGLDDGTVSAVIVYELLTMLPVVRAFARSGAAITSEGPVDVSDIDDTLTPRTTATSIRPEEDPR